MTSRDYIYRRARNDLKEGAFPLLRESQVVIDVHDLTQDERQQTLYNHIRLGCLTAASALYPRNRPTLGRSAGYERSNTRPRRDQRVTEARGVGDAALRAGLDERSASALARLASLMDESAATRACSVTEDGNAHAGVKGA
jgi:hypothetical protein